MAKNGADKQSSGSPSNAMPSPTHGINRSFMSFQPPPLSPFPPYDGHYSGMTQQPMSYMSMLQSPQGLFHPTYSSQSSGHPQMSPPQMSPQMSPTIGDSSGKVIHEIDEEEHTSPIKKGKKLAHKKKVPATRLNSRGVANKKWAPEHDDVLIPYLAELALDGMKPDKNFKAEAYSMAAMKINMQFQETFNKLHVINHLKCLRNKFNDMKACLDISGAGWDEENQMITLDEETMKSWTQDKINFRLKAYINKPLPHYKNLQIIMGDDQVKGAFVRSVFDDIGYSRSIPIDDDDNAIPEHSETEPQSDANNVTEPSRSKNKSKDSLKSFSSKKSRKSNDQEELLCSFVETMSQSIRNQHMVQHMVHWTEQLASALKEHSADYSEVFLDKLLDHLYDDEREARRFIIKSKEARKRYIVSLINEHHWTVS